MSNWLSNRLTPSKIKEARWVEFSTVLEHVWEEFFDPGMSRMERLRSSYTADDADLIKKIREMGDYFSFDRPRYEDRPVSVAWRRLELEYKDMELILTSVFRRHYSNLPVTWFPIFAPKDVPYGSMFKVAEGPWPERKNIPPDGMFLTSRGRLGTDYGYLLSLGLTKQAFLEKALPLLMRTKPLHIVYDGALWYIRFDIPFEADFTSKLWWERDCEQFELQFTVLGSRFDYTAADARYLDIQSALCKWERDNICKVSFIPEYGHTWRLDYCLKDKIPSDWLPTDTLITGTEVDKNPFILVAAISFQKYDLFVEFAKSDYSSSRIDHTDIDFTEIDINCLYSHNFRWLMPFLQNNWRLDYFLKEKFPSDWLPIDTLITGVETDKNHFILVATASSRKYDLFVEFAKANLNIVRIDKNSIDFTKIAINHLYGHEQKWNIPFIKKRWYLDYYLPENFPVDWLPSDTFIVGKENNEHLFVIVASQTEQNFITTCGNIKFDLLLDNQHNYNIPVQKTFIKNRYNNKIINFDIKWLKSEWHLDTDLPNIPDGWLISPVVAGTENCKQDCFCFIDNGEKCSLSMQRCEAHIKHAKQNISLAYFNAGIDFPREETANVFPIKTDFSQSGRLDCYPCFDTFPADQFPLDMPIGGVYA